VKFPAKIGWRDHALGAALGLVYTVWLLATAHEVGFPRDESFYFHAAAAYGGWWRMLFERGSEAISQGSIDSAFGYNHEHPALMKSLFGLSEIYLHDKWQLMKEASDAFRLPAMVFAGAAVWTTYLFGARAWSRRAGIAAAALFALMPRVFFHAHLACFDVPITTMWILCIYVHWRAQETRAIGWAIAAGIVFGLTLETKHNAWELPAVFVPHAFFVHRHAIWRALRVGRLPVPLSLVSMAILGPIVFYALWPYLWYDTLGRVQWYVNFHLNHEYYNIEFFGKNYYSPPSPKSYLPVMVLATVPAVTLLLFAVGAVERAAAGVRRLLGWLREVTDRPGERVPGDPRETDLLVALSIVVAMAPWLSSTTPIFGGTKHWMPAYPGLALFAGRGFDLVWQKARAVFASLEGRRWVAVEAALWVCVLAAPLAVTAHAFPFGLSAYVPLVGGTAGGADLGLNRQFWGYTSQNAAEEYLNANAPPNATVFIHDTTWDAWGRMQQEGRVRSDLRATGSPGEAQIALVEHELHMNEVDYSTWVAFGTDAPVYIVRHDGVPIVSIYRR
jgi:4-amino-4-deoxy-L-arabinose transferase-like glycosyltransferase